MPEQPSFEKDLEQLEQIVEALEEGQLSLDDSLKKFEEGIRLTKRCEKALAQAEKKIEILTKNEQGELVVEPFGEEAIEETAAAESKPKPAAKKKAAPEPLKEAEDEKEEEDTEGELLF